MPSLKVLVSNVLTQSGTGKTGNPYSMSRTSVLLPFTNVDRPNMKIVGTGYEALDLSVSNEFIAEFQQRFNADFKGLPVHYELETILDREGKNVVSGFSSAAAPDRQKAA